MIREELYHKGVTENLYKLFLSKEFGGRDESMVSGIELIKQLAFEDGDLGWSVAIGTGGNYFSAYMQVETAKKIFNPENALIAGSGASTGSAVRTFNGWTVSGYWKYCSGCKNATTFTFNCIQDNNKILTVAVPAEKVQIHAVWNALGMQNTDTHDVSLTGVFVPDEFTFNFEKTIHVNHPTQSMSFLLFAEMCFIGVVEGLNSRLIKLAKMTASKQKLSDQQIDENRLQKLENNILENSIQADRRWQNIMALALQFWEAHVSGKASDTIQDDLSRAIRQHNAACRAESNLLFGKLGMTALDLNNTMNKCYRDLLTASQHSVLRIKD